MKQEHSNDYLKLANSSSIKKILKNGLNFNRQKFLPYPFSLEQILYSCKLTKINENKKKQKNSIVLITKSFFFNIYSGGILHSSSYIPVIEIFLSLELSCIEPNTHLKDRRDHRQHIPSKSIHNSCC